MGAWISDRFGAYYVILIGSVSQILGQIIVILNDAKQNSWVYGIAYIFFGGADSCFQTQALALTLYHYKRYDFGFCLYSYGKFDF